MNYKTISRIIVTLLLVGFTITDASAQVVQKIGSNSFTIDPKAVLELESTTKGFLPPRMTIAQQTTMGTSLPDGLVVYITDGSLAGLQIWKGSKWTFFLGTTLGSGQILVGNASASASAVTLSGDVNIDNTGIATIQVSTITSSKIADGTIATIDIVDGAITNDKITSGIDKLKVGLGSVDNTSDLLKPISTATQTALDLKENTADKSTNIYTDRASDIKYPSVKAVKTYVDVYSTFNAISTITANYTATSSDYTILCNNNGGTFQLTLPSAASISGKIYVIRKTDESTNLLTISPSLKLTESTTISSLDYPKTIRIQSDGTSWYIID